MKCPVRVKGYICGFEFKGSHYTEAVPHLETHTVRELSKALHSKMTDIQWVATMSKEIIECAETLVKKGDFEKP